MGFLIYEEELAALSGLPHLQQLVYLRGLRPYMDAQMGMVGVKRRISYQSIAEQLYVEPSQGIKSQSFSRDQVRRALLGLERAGIINIQSEGMHLILECKLANKDCFVQNKPATNPPQKAAINPPEKNLVDTGFFEGEVLKAAIVEPPKAATPLIYKNINKINNNKQNKQTETTVRSNCLLRKKTIALDFYPSQETITIALGKGLDKVTDAKQIQAFINHNLQLNSTWADFNPIFIRWLEREAMFQQSQTKLRSNRNDCYPNQNTAYETLIARVKQAHQVTLSTEERDLAIKVSPFKALD